MKTFKKGEEVFRKDSSFIKLYKHEVQTVSGTCSIDCSIDRPAASGIIGIIISCYAIWILFGWLDRWLDAECAFVLIEAMPSFRRTL